MVHLVGNGTGSSEAPPSGEKDKVSWKRERPYENAHTREWRSQKRTLWFLGAVAYGLWALIAHFDDKKQEAQARQRAANERSFPTMDPIFDTCAEALANGYGPYLKDIDIEYGFYFDADFDGIVCEYYRP